MSAIYSKTLENTASYAAAVRLANLKNQIVTKEILFYILMSLGV